MKTLVLLVALLFPCTASAVPITAIDPFLVSFTGVSCPACTEARMSSFIRFFTVIPEGTLTATVFDPLGTILGSSGPQILVNGLNGIGFGNSSGLLEFPSGITGEFAIGVTVQGLGEIDLKSVRLSFGDALGRTVFTAQTIALLNTHPDIVTVPLPDMFWPTAIGLVGLMGFVAWRQRRAT